MPDPETNLPANKISKVKLDSNDDNSIYEIIPERLQKSGFEAALPTLTADSTIALKSDLTSFVHKGTSSSSVPETIYGNKTFANKVNIYNGFEFRNADYTYPPTVIISGHDGLNMQFNGSSQYLKVSTSPAGYINIQPNTSSVGTISNQYLKDNTTFVTNTFNLPNDSGTLALDEDAVHKTGIENITGTKTFTSSGSINTNVIISGGYGSQSGYEADAIGGLMLTGAASGMSGKATLLLAHAGSSSSTSSPVQVYLPNKTGTLATTDDIRQYQANTVIVKDALTNVSSKSLSAYTAIEDTRTIGGRVFDVIIIKKNNAILDETTAKSYMKAQTGSEYLPWFSYDSPCYTYLIFENGKVYKAQYDTTDGLVL